MRKMTVEMTDEEYKWFLAVSDNNDFSLLTDGDLIAVLIAKHKDKLVMREKSIFKYEFICEDYKQQKVTLIIDCNYKGE